MVYCAAVGYLLFYATSVIAEIDKFDKCACYYFASFYDQDMETLDIPLPANHSCIATPALIEQAITEAGLLAQRLELRSYPGATHWHIRRPGAKGTLELTYWPRAGRLWFAVHANRRADWIAPAIDDLSARITL